MTGYVESEHRRGGNPANTGQYSAKANSAPGDVLAAATLAGAPVPEYRPESLAHIGSLDPTEKGRWSLEGQGLSVSRHPEAWGRIARLGSPVWTVGSPQPRFLDYHELGDDQKQAITDWGVERGYVEQFPAWRMTYWDDEWEQERFVDYLDREEADEESEYTGGEVIEVTALVATAEFPDQTVKPGTDSVEEILATVWVQEEATTFDGVWWEDDYDPELLSAPRGVIVPRAIQAWVDSAAPYDGRFDE